MDFEYQDYFRTQTLSENYREIWKLRQKIQIVIIQ